MTTDTPHTTPSAASTTEPDAGLKSAPLAQVEKQLGYSPQGLSQAEAAKRLAQYGPNEIAEHKTNPLLKVPQLLLGPIPWMIEIAVVLSGRGRALAGFLHHPASAGGNGVVAYTRNARPATPLTR